MQPVLDRLLEEPVPDRHYDTIPPAQPPPDGALRVLPSHDFLDRDGQSVVRMSRSLFDQRDRPKHVMVRPVLEGSDGSEVLALVLVDERSRETSAIEVDQAIRNAIGVEVGENVAIGPARVQRRRWPDWIIGRPTYVTARVQGADLAMVEREICLIDALTLELLGIESGEEVVLEGRSVNGGPVPQIRICAFATNNEIQQRRQDLDGGDASTLFPSSRDALGVYPDLPWVFLDRATRLSLGLHRKLAPVRIRSSRSFQLRRELREMMLLFGIAFIGVLQIIREPVWQLISLGFLVGLVLLSMAIRMRGRLSRRVHRMAGRFWLPSLPRR